jgi:hypothetical protein
VQSPQEASPEGFVLSGYAEYSSWSLKPKGGNHEVHEAHEDLRNNQLVWVFFVSSVFVVKI